MTMCAVSLVRDTKALPGNPGDRVKLTKFFFKHRHIYRSYKTTLMEASIKMKSVLGKMDQYATYYQWVVFTGETDFLVYGQGWG